ncbi:Short-chain-enoyl-CoA hydratase [Saezia sanguinis]|uniref:3-hydroxyisobutyryl-CoA hydrolase n=1 Tax=Saezia sanguinis TaxID=1965230 RepID=A0A433S9M5_9BURK|nr:Short-chain-enoyl-CoA hydratase [Saezia sanguinis]
MPVNTPVSFAIIPTKGSHTIGRITLNSPKTLNGLTYEMVRLIGQQLQAWRYDPNMVAVWLEGEGDKAFCAGADLRQLYQALTAPQDPLAEHDIPSYAQEFFAKEYQLDYFIHHYPKPIIAWLHGFVMGGGIGLSHGARYRIATENATFSMPEISIGLFPDVAGSWFLGQIPARIGRFIALTAARLNAADALFSGLADMIIEHQRKQDVIGALTWANWQTDPVHNEHTLHNILQSFASWQYCQNSTLIEHAAELAALCNAPDCRTFLMQLMQLGQQNTWFEPYMLAARNGAPSSLYLSWILQDMARTMSLADVYKMEFNAAMGCCARGDLVEGIRALVIDKDKKPDWLPAASDEKDLTELIEFYLIPRYHGVHMLSDLAPDTL